MTILERFRDIIDEARWNSGGAIPPVVIELGANDGYHTRLLADILAFGEWRMLAVEPDHRCFPRLQDDTEAHADHIRYVLAAISDANGYVPFFLSDGEERRPGQPPQKFSGSSSILMPTGTTKAWPDMTFKETWVKARTLDSFAGWAGDRVDFIWADIQGAELKMIRGGRSVLARTRYLYTEYGGGMYEGDSSLADILAALPDWAVVEDYGGDILLRNNGVQP